MATWEELSRDSLRAAKLLAEKGHFRSSVSRAYYAAYCAITGKVTSLGMSFPRGWSNPTHEQLPELVRHNLSLPRETRRWLSRNIHILREAREDADYRPGISIPRDTVRNCLRLSSWVISALEINDD